MCSGTSKVGTWRTGLSKRPTSSELDGSSSDTETEQTDHCARGSEVAKGGGAKAARSHTRQVRFATPDASVELYALTLVGGHLREAVPVISRVARELHQLLDPCGLTTDQLPGLSWEHPEREEGRGGKEREHRIY